MGYKRLLAKSSKTPDDPLLQETLTGHSLGVCNTVDVLCDILSSHIKDTISCGEDIIQAWKKAVWMGCWFHDLGKASSDFQMMVRCPSHPQKLRHESLSILMLEELYHWLSPVLKDLPSWAESGLLFAIGGHHLKFPDPLSEKQKRPPGKVTIFWEHPDMKETLKIGEKYLGLTPAPRMADKTYDVIRNKIEKRAHKFLQQRIPEDGDFGETEKFLISSVKNTIMTADLGGSALPGKVEDPVIWVKDRIGKTLTTEQLSRLVEMRLGNKKTYGFPGKSPKFYSDNDFTGSRLWQWEDCIRLFMGFSEGKQ